MPCDPNARHPYPVVLVHGTFETMEQNWDVLSPRLKEKGYCVFALNYGNRGLGCIEESAHELDIFVNKVLAYTDAKKASLVSHSQGGMMPRYWTRFIQRLNEGDDTPGVGSFTQIATDDDEIIIPYTNCFLEGTERTRNVTLQNYNGGLPVTRQNIYNDPFAQDLVFDALANPGPANPKRTFY